MENKFIAKTIAIVTIAMLASTQVSLAHTSEVNVEDLIANDADTVVQYNNSQNNSLKEAFEEDILSQLLSIIEDEELSEKVKEQLQNTLLTVVINAGDEEMAYVTFTMEKDEYDQIIKYDEENNIHYEKETYKNYDIYKTNEDMYMTNIEDIVVVSQTSETVKELIDRLTSQEQENLANNTTYTKAKEHKVKGSFLDIYLTKDALNQNSMEAIMPNTSTDMLNAIEAEMISIAQTETGFNFNVYIKADQKALESINQPFNKYNTTLKLYKEISGKNIMLFTEFGNTNNLVTDAISNSAMEAEKEAYTNFKEWLKEETDIDFEKEFLPVMKGNTAIAIHNTNELIPAVTILTDVSKNKATAAKLVNKINDSLEKKLAEKEGYSHSIEYVNNQAFYKHTFKEDEVEVSVRFAIISNGTLVISTNNDLANILKKDNGMEANESFKEMQEMYKETANENNIFYVNFNGFRDYLSSLPDADEDVLEMLTPLKDIYIKSYASEDEQWGGGSFRIDMKSLIQKLDDLGMFGTEDFTEEMDPFTYINDTDSSPDNIETTFCDVDYEDWFFEDVSFLSDLEIINGYEDGCFHPNNQVTRAEFTKMAIEGTDYAEGFNWIYDLPTTDAFTDVTSSDWFAEYVSQAKANEFINGYTDRTFRPNQPITRAEAIKILYAMNSELNTLENPFEGGNPFTDITTTDWFFTPVGITYNQEIINGKTETVFAPNDNLTRAEAAKIVSRLILQSGY